MAAVANPVNKPAEVEKKVEEAQVKKPGALETGYKTYVVDFVSSNSCKCLGNGFKSIFDTNDKDWKIVAIAKMVFGTIASLPTMLIAVPTWAYNKLRGCCTKEGAKKDEEVKKNEQEVKKEEVKNDKVEENKPADNADQAGDANPAGDAAQ